MIRLQGPLSANGTGRVEVYFQGQWGTICNSGWGINDARVACRQLGYKYALRVLPSSQVPNVGRRVWLDNVQCRGNEQSLASCLHRGWGRYYCSRYYTAGIECSSIGKLAIIIIIISFE